MDNFHKPIYEVMHLVAVKAFFLGGADELLNRKRDRRGEPRNFKQDLVLHVNILSGTVEPVTFSVKQQAKRAVNSEAKLRQENIRNVAVKDDLTPPSPLTGRTRNSSKTSRDNKQENKMKKAFSYNHSKSPSFKICDSSRRQDDHKAGKLDGGPELIQVLKPVHSNVTDAL